MEGFRRTRSCDDEMTITSAGIALIKRHEQCRLKAYKDPVGIWTIGWGHTGPDVIEGLEITQAQADALLAADLARFDEAITDKCPEASDLQHDAMCSLAFNVGIGAFQKSSVARLHNAGRYSEACQAFSLWNKAGGRVLIELVHRRAEESAMYAEGTTIPPGVRVDVPGDAEGEKPLLTSRTVISTATAGLGTAASVASQINTQAQAVKQTTADIHDAVVTGFDLWAAVGHYGGYLASGLIMAGLCGIAYSRWSDHRTGRN